jgi:hypothetical protein
MGSLHGPDASSLSARRHDNSNQALHATPAPNPNCVRNRNRPLVTVDLLPRPEHQLPTPTPAPPSLSIAPPPPLRLCTSAPLRLCTPASSTTLSLCSFPNPHHALPDHPHPHTPPHHCRILPKSTRNNSFPYRPRKHTQLPAMSSPKRRIETDLGDPGRHFLWSTCA